MNEVNQAAPVSTLVSAVTDPHTLSHFYRQNISVEHDWILALTVDIHSCSHVTASNMRPMVDSGAPFHVCPAWYGFSPLSLLTCYIILEAKTESYVFRSLKFQVNSGVALVVRPILSVDMLTRKGVLVVFGVQGSSSFIQLPDGHEIPTLVDRRNMKMCRASHRYFHERLQGFEKPCLARSLHHDGVYLHDARKPKMETTHTSTIVR